MRHLDAKVTLSCSFLQVGVPFKIGLLHVIWAQNTELMYDLYTSLCISHPADAH